MKALLAPIGSRGDIQPMLLLGSELRQRGHEVTIATCPNFRDWVTSEGFPFVPLGADSQVTIRNNTTLAEQNPILSLPRLLKVLTNETERQCAELLEASLPRFDLIVGAGLSFAARLLAERQGARYAFLCYTLSAIESDAHPPATLPIFGLPRWANRTLWSLAVRGFARSVGVPLSRVRSKYGLSADPSPWHTIHASNAILAQDRVIGDLPSGVRAEAVQVPALSRRAGAAPLPGAVEAFLERRGSERLVYVGFGSMPTVQRSRVIEAVTAFCRAHGARALLFSSYAEDAGMALPETILSVGSLDHARLFPRLDLVVHHGGAGTTATALRAGTPQLIVPHIVDQFFHGRRIAELGLGPAPVQKKALRQRLLGLSWVELGQARRRAQSVAQGLEVSGAAAAATYLEQLGFGAPGRPIK
jgi:UDP:flavonoid glycosyltransferase YjiC (YdhE family)